jgi:hypothetical protein
VLRRFACYTHRDKRPLNHTDTHIWTRAPHKHTAAHTPTTHATTHALPALIFDELFLTADHTGHPSVRHSGLEWPVSDPDVAEWFDLRLFRADLKPGDLLLIPSLWIHTTEVEGDDPSLGFSM